MRHVLFEGEQEAIVGGFGQQRLVYMATGGQLRHEKQITMFLALEELAIRRHNIAKEPGKIGYTAGQAIRIFVTGHKVCLAVLRRGIHLALYHLQATLPDMRHQSRSVGGSSHAKRAKDVMVDVLEEPILTAKPLDE